MNHHRRAVEGARKCERRAKNDPMGNTTKTTKSWMCFARRHAAARARSRGDAVATISPRLEPTTRIVLPVPAATTTCSSVASDRPPAISFRRARGTSKRRAHAFAVASLAAFGTETIHSCLPRFRRLERFPATAASVASLRNGAAHAGQETYWGSRA